VLNSIFLILGNKISTEQISKHNHSSLSNYESNVLNSNANNITHSDITNENNDHKGKNLDASGLTGENFFSFNKSIYEKNKEELNELSIDGLSFKKNLSNNMIRTSNKVLETGKEEEADDVFDQKLMSYLNEFYASKKISIIQFKKINNSNEYQYGTQKVKLYNENDVFKVKLNNQGAVLLSRFIEANATNEEIKMLKNNTMLSNNNKQ